MSQTAIKTATRTLTSYKWDQVINEFLTNGRNAPKAYEKVYPDCNTVFQAANQLFKNNKFAIMLNKRVDKIREKTDIDVGILEAMYQKGFNTADKQKNPTGMAVNTTGIARLYGKDKDNNVKDQVQIVINPPLSPKRAESKVIDNECT